VAVWTAASSNSAPDYATANRQAEAGCFGHLGLPLFKDRPGSLADPQGVVHAADRQDDDQGVILAAPQEIDLADRLAHDTDQVCAQGGEARCTQLFRPLLAAVDRQQEDGERVFEATCPPDLLIESPGHRHTIRQRYQQRLRVLFRDRAEELWLRWRFRHGRFFAARRGGRYVVTLALEDDRGQCRAGDERRARIFTEGCLFGLIIIQSGHRQDAARLARADRGAERDRGDPQAGIPIGPALQWSVGGDNHRIGGAKRVHERWRGVDMEFGQLTRAPTIGGGPGEQR
jgi:hypothetical protein